jgi:hypothetical protein
MGRTRDVSKILTSNTSILSLASASSTYQTIAKTGLVEITPSTVSVTGGSGSISATGVVSFSGASSVSINGCFTSTYDDYLILMDSVHSATITDVNFRMRLSGTDNTATEYSTQITNSETTNVTAARTSKATSSVITRTTTGRAITQLVVFNPATTNFTQILSDLSFYPNLAVVKYAGLHEVATAYDSMTFIITTGTMTGTISVYGYNK